jgi:hypothetical protein
MNYEQLAINVIHSHMLHQYDTQEKELKALKELLVNTFEAIKPRTQPLHEKWHTHYEVSTLEGIHPPQDYLFALRRNKQPYVSILSEVIQGKEVTASLPECYFIVSFSTDKTVNVINEKGASFSLSNEDFRDIIFGTDDGYYYYNVVGKPPLCKKYYRLVIDSACEHHNVFGWQHIGMLHEYSDGTALCICDGHLDELSRKDQQYLHAISQTGGWYQLTVK